FEGTAVTAYRLATLAALLGLVAVCSGCATGFGGPATNITASKATLTGSVASNRSEPGEWGFKFGKTTRYGSATPHPSIAFPANQKHSVSEPLTGLAPATSYHYQLCAKDQQTGTCSSDKTFATCNPGTAGCAWEQGNMATFDQHDWGNNG